MAAPSVCMVVANYPPHGGGSERQCALLARHLARRGIAVTVLTRRLDGAPRTQDADGVAVHRLGLLPGNRWVHAAAFAGATLRHLARGRRRFRIVHCHGFEPLALPGLVARRLFGMRLVIKVVTSGSYGDIARLSAIPGWRRLARFLARADAIVVLNEEAQRELAAVGAPPQRLFMIPNGVEIPAGPRPPGGDTVLYCGRLVGQKNVAGLLRAWARTRTAATHCLAVVGDGPERAELTALARVLGVERSVRFHGHVLDVAAFHRRAACCVLFSHAEGLSNALLEALAAGVPVIASDIAGTRDVIRHETTGLLVPPGDEAALAAAIDRLLEAPDLAAHLAEAGRTLVAARYGIEAVAAQIHGLYERITAP